jgi:hypothetical protein
MPWNSWLYRGLLGGDLLRWLSIRFVGDFLRWLCSGFDRGSALRWLLVNGFYSLEFLLVVIFFPRLSCFTDWRRITELKARIF